MPLLAINANNLPICPTEKLCQAFILAARFHVAQVSELCPRLQRARTFGRSRPARSLATDSNMHHTLVVGDKIESDSPRIPITAPVQGLISLQIRGYFENAAQDNAISLYIRPEFCLKV
jgi:hypothetical protein